MAREKKPNASLWLPWQAKQLWSRDWSSANLPNPAILFTRYWHAAFPAWEPVCWTTNEREGNNEKRTHQRTIPVVSQGSHVNIDGGWVRS